MGRGDQQDRKGMSGPARETVLFPASPPPQRKADLVGYVTRRSRLLRPSWTCLFQLGPVTPQARGVLLGSHVGGSC